MQGENSKESPIEYASKLFAAPERYYSTTECEALAVQLAKECFHGYLKGAKITVITDHQPLRWLMSYKYPSSHLARWAVTLQTYDPQIDYALGHINVIADILSCP